MQFTKMQANGNDYIYIDLHTEKIDDPASQAIRLCDRHFGIGGDGLVLLCPCEEADFHMRIFDPDGTEAELCGNALQCSAVLYALSRKAKQEEVFIKTQAGIRKVSLRHEGNAVSEVSVTLPYPKVLFADHRILLKDSFFPSSYISFGNPHCVVITDDLSDGNFLCNAPLLEKHPLFPNRANVEFVQILSGNEFRMRTWERGCGETLSCSTGSGAAVFAAYEQGLCGRSVTVVQPGGSIFVELNVQEQQVMISSQAKIIFRGECPEL